MKPWTSTHTIACLWMLAMILAVGWLAGLVAQYQERLEYGGIQQPTAPVSVKHCVRAGPWCQ